MNLPITVILSQNDWYGLRFSTMWSLFSGHPMMICSFSCWKWLSCGVTCCSSCIIMHSGIFVVICTVLMFTCTPVISSLFLLWFWDLEQLCVLFWLCIVVFWGGFVDVFVIVSLHHFWIMLPVVCDLWLYSPLCQSSNNGTFQDYVVYLVLPFLCCCISFLGFLDSLANGMVWVHCCLVQYL